MGPKKSSKKVKKFVGGCVLSVLVMVIVVVAVVLLGGPDMEPKLKAQFDAAEATYHEGKFAEAEAAYLKAKELAPENPLILARLGEIALWNNRTDDAERYFGEALRNTPWYENFWPLNSQLKYRLAMTEYRRDRFAQATQYFNEAAGPIALGPLQELKTLGQHTALFAN
jgi:tetratricopeptide (TPR) repeat protein